MRKPIDGRADLYALGVLAYLLISGDHPFKHARSYGDMIAAHVEQAPVPLSSLRSDVPPEVDSLISTLMQKDAARRYPDAPTLAAQLNLLIAGIPPEPGMTIRTDEGEEDTFLSDIPSKPR
jgi:serine/threonine-protein kinase